jgi:hypothetical protein
MDENMSDDASIPDATSPSSPSEKVWLLNAHIVKLFTAAADLSADLRYYESSRTK